MPKLTTFLKIIKKNYSKRLFWRGSLAFRFLLVALGLALTIRLHGALAVKSSPQPIPTTPQRIITLAPSVTETFFALDLGQKVVGRTRYCQYPQGVLDLPIVASFSQLNYESIIRLKPDLVALPTDRSMDKTRLERLGLAVLPLDTRSLTGFRQGVEILGQKLNRAQKAQEILAKIDQSAQKARRQSQGRVRPRVLFSVMRDYEGLGYISEINAVGRDGFYDQILAITGAENAYQGPLAFPRLSRESIIFLNPDIIVDIILNVENLEEVQKDWLSLTAVKAIQNRRVHLLTEQSDTVPGPRIYLTIDRLANFFHPVSRS
ncbi:MAG: helical backbone metal receptor [Deltaproteobacteria bacterium]|jgi:iron complex transport system substrate-binding protein|nr:helical backbone metal receptor [Deltaproteobacteria bacterium]